MKILSASIVVFSGAVCIAAGALSGNSATGSWAAMFGTVLSLVGVITWAKLVGWINSDWGPPAEP